MSLKLAGRPPAESTYTTGARKADDFSTAPPSIHHPVPGTNCSSWKVCAFLRQVKMESTFSSGAYFVANFVLQLISFLKLPVCPAPE